MPPCEVCGKEGGFKCGRCKQVFYCSAEHQRSGWKTHKSLCQKPCDPVCPAVNSDGHASITQPSIYEKPGVEQKLKRAIADLLSQGLCLYINLDRRQDRRSRMEALAKPHEWLNTSMQRLPAVDGRNLDWDTLHSYKLLTADAVEAARDAEHMKLPTMADTAQDCSPHLTLGACGCGLSHRSAWQLLVDSDKQWALIFEDDLSSFCGDFDRQLASVVQKLPSGWQFCYVGFHGGALLPAGKQVVGPLMQLNTLEGYLAGLWGYLITKPYAKHLISKSFPMTSQIDQIVGCSVTESDRTYALPPEQFLAYSEGTEISHDTDVQTFSDDFAP